MTNSTHAPGVQPFPGRLTTEHHRQFADFGYLAFNDVLTPDEISTARDALGELSSQLLDKARRGEARVTQNDQAIKNYAGIQLSDPERSYSILFEAGVDPLAMPPGEAELAFRKVHGYEQAHPFFANLAFEHPRIIDVMSDILGERCVMKGAMALSKPPHIGSEKPWHQDNAYFDWLPLDKLATAWVALDDATIENGCMYVIPGDHKRGALKHFHTIDCEILPDRLDKSQAIPLPVKAGGVLFFSAMLPHQTPPNRSDKRRRALQFQYRGVSTRQVSREEFGRVFAEADGTPASCALAHEDG